jgi:hypothetical protein
MKKKVVGSFSGNRIQTVPDLVALEEIRGCFLVWRCVEAV